MAHYSQLNEFVHFETTDQIKYVLTEKAKRYTQIKCQQEDSEMAQWVTPEDLSSPDHRVVP